MTKKGYTFGEPVRSSEVPNWARREPKWQELIDRIMQLPVGESLPVFFESEEDANRARNTVRDTVNLRLGVAQIRTRFVKNENGSATLYFTMLRPEEVVEEVRKSTKK